MMLKMFQKMKTKVLKMKVIPFTMVMKRFFPDNVLEETIFSNKVLISRWASSKLDGFGLINL